MSEEKGPDHKKVLNLYAAYGVGLFLAFVPAVIAILTSAVFTSGTLIACYVLRGRTEKNSLLENHTTYIIRTIWIGGLITITSILTASVYMHYALDFSSMQGCAPNLLPSVQAMGNNPDMPQVMALLTEMLGHMSPCLEAFYKANIPVFYMSGAIAITPIVLYFGIRYFRGLSRASRGYRIANPLSWF